MLWLGILPLIFHVSAAQKNDFDLLSFIILPEIRALKFEIESVDRERQIPGYWFVAPYGQIDPEAPTHRYEQYQVGPYIYDNEGMLIWADSPLFNNRNIFDFKANWNINDEPHLSFILQHQFDNSNKGSGVIMEKTYRIEHQVGVTNDVGAFNMYEFNILDGDRTALACTYRDRMTDLSDLDRPDEDSWVITGGFVELDVETGCVLFKWDSLDQVPLHESARFHAWGSPDGKPGSDYVHINAVDKNDAGDYIISLRFTNTVYMISGRDGRIMWRLGGNETDFDQDFTFHKQHDVRFLESDGNRHIISLMNNGADEDNADEQVSAALYIELDSNTMTARVIKRTERPDGGLTRLRGNVQHLSNNNTFIGWSERGYHSEHAPNGDLLMWARFASTRFSSYRSYKFDWIGRPTAPPNVVSAVYGTSDDDFLTIIYVSWNGATDVARWDFYARAYNGSDRLFIGNIEKVSFESMFLVDGFMDWVSVEVVDKFGAVMGTSLEHRTNLPTNWIGLEVDDPALLFPSNSSVSTGTGDAKEAVYQAYELLRGVEGFIAFLVIVSCIGCGSAVVMYVLRRRKSVYQNIPLHEGENLPIKDIPLYMSSDS
ncbi:hypothetical protein N7495_009025 [Penicillium taxi]|uniref:uncharacterized protein n=1 Tax=Penicillium taxi TaxID=168475 RepID=UPI002544D67C|nr:uncharacterized protein N7495_009025 [Penicillium taxi]KAJ5888984.1 hypothetical protein N7495_009025 [Penicillium taxi]